MDVQVREWIRAKPRSVQNLVDVFVRNDVRKRASTTLAFVRYVFMKITWQLYDRARQVQMSSTRAQAAQLENDKTTKRVFLHHLRVSYKMYATLTIHESCLDDFHDTVRKRGFILSVVWPLGLVVAWRLKSIFLSYSLPVYVSMTCVFLVLVFLCGIALGCTCALLLIVSFMSRESVAMATN